MLHILQDVSDSEITSGVQSNMMYYNPYRKILHTVPTNNLNSNLPAYVRSPPLSRTSVKFIRGFFKEFKF